MHQSTMERYVKRGAKRPLISSDWKSHFKSDTYAAGKSSKYDVACAYCSWTRKGAGADECKAHLNGEQSRKAKPCKKVLFDVRDLFRDASSSGPVQTSMTEAFNLIEQRRFSTVEHADARFKIAHWLFTYCLQNSCYVCLGTLIKSVMYVLLC